MAVVLILPCGTARAIEEDKVAHFGMSYALTVGGYIFAKNVFHLKEQEKFKALLFAVSLSFTVGVVKEAIDAIRCNSWKLDGADLRADALGNLSGALTLWIVDF